LISVGLKAVYELDVNMEAVKQAASVLVIDDNRTRDAVYRNFFKVLSAHDEFMYSVNVIIPDSPTKAIHEILRKSSCLVVLDMMLTDEWEAHTSHLYEALKRSGVSIGMLSLDFTAEDSAKAANRVLTELKGCPKAGFWPYEQTIERHGAQNMSLLANQISVWNLTFNEALGFGKHFQPNTVGEVTFLHLTDTHFGKTTPDFLNAIEISNGAKGINNLPNEQAKHLQVDHILWTGDITNTGMPAEFDLALKFRSQLESAAMLTESTPISVAPGNHDLCWPLALSSRLKFFENKEEMKSWWQLDYDSKFISLWEFGMQPFRKFHRQIVGQDAPEQEVGFSWHPEWAGLGYAVLVLPIENFVVKIKSGDGEITPAPFINEQQFKNITDQAIKAIKASLLNKGVCIIVLIHGRTPDQPDSGAKRWDRLMDLIIQEGHPLLVIGGHEHETTHLAKGRRLTIIGTPHAVESTKGSETLPGVGFIRLKGLGTAALSCELVKVQKGRGDKDPDKWIQLPATRFVLKSDGQRQWIED
jgi:hypothetical protein